MKNGYLVSYFKKGVSTGWNYETKKVVSENAASSLIKELKERNDVRLIDKRKI